MCALPMAAGILGGAAGRIGRIAMVGPLGALIGGGGRKKPRPDAYDAHRQVDSAPRLPLLGGQG